jgi:hypothetical protein
MGRLFRTGLTVVALASASIIVWTQVPSTAAPAQPAASTAPPAAATAAPADAPKRRELVVPPGYQKVTVGAHTALCEPGDAAWVRQALEQVKPTARPSPAPADVIKALADKRAGLAQQVMTDLALPDGRSAGEFLDGKLIPTLKKLDEARPPVFFLVTTREKLRDLTKTGWGEPRFHYNGVADAAAFDTSISFSIDRPMDDTVLPEQYTQATPIPDRVKGLAAEVGQLDDLVARKIADQVTPATFTLFAQFIRERHLDPLKLRRDQQWLAMGISNLLAVKYTNTVTGAPRNDMLRSLASEPANFPVSARSIDLTHPADEASMRAELAPYYAQSMQKKSLAVVAYWVEQAGEAAIPKTLTALRKGVPADAAGLVKLVQQASGTDLSRYVAGQ